MEEKGKILSIDYGLKRIGVAVSDEYRIIAKPLITIINSTNSHNEIIKLIEELKVNLVLIGIPYRNDNKNDNLIKNIKEFANQIQTATNIEIKFVDEFMTSKKAVEIMVTNKKKKSIRRQKTEVDKVAAAVILQEYLENN